MLRFTNMVNIYDNNGAGNYSYANAMTNTLMLDVAWKWLPKTAIFLNVQQGLRRLPQPDAPQTPTSCPTRIRCT